MVNETRLRIISMELHAYQIGNCDVIAHYSPQEALMLFRRETGLRGVIGMDDVTPIDAGLFDSEVIDGEGCRLGTVGDIIAAQAEPGWLVSIDYSDDE